jgi:hypothetical protein
MASFPSALRDKLLLWCDRHCCLCKKACDVFIEVHHIDRDGGDDEDNAIPLCFDCHGKVSHYDPKQPIGTRFKPAELRTRRDQVYDHFTSHLVPALNYGLRQALGGDHYRELPDVGLYVQHLGDAPPVKVEIKADAYVNGVLENHPNLDPMYSGGLRWNLNPKSGVHGHFPLPDSACRQGTDIRVGIHVVVYDCYDRGHELLPVTHVYKWDQRSWYLDPFEPTVSLRRGLSRSDNTA